MRQATIVFAMLFLLAACVTKEPPPEEPGEVIIEMILADDESGQVYGTALIPKRLAYEYQYIGLYEGEPMPPGTDFDIVQIPMKGGGHIDILCIR